MNIESFSGVTLILGTLILMIGLLFRIFQPKNINRFYGYRTQNSMRNKNAWSMANKYSANLMIIYGALSAIAGIISSFIPRLNTNYTGFGILLIILFFGLIIYQTESLLKKHFN